MVVQTLVVLCLLLGLARSEVFTTYLWHMQQPIYWPDAIPSTTTYQKAWDSIQLKPKQNGHPQNDIVGIFSEDDRVNDYQHYAVDAINSCSDLPDMGAQMSFSGCLIENMNSLAGNMGGYSPGWQNTYANAFQNMKTSQNCPRLDLVSFTYHHALAALIDRNTLAKEIEIHKVIHKKTWGSSAYSKGFFPAEMTFSERAIPTLVDQGLEWVIVSNNHISRCVENYPFSKAGDNNNPPNRADQQNPPQSQWFNRSISRGVTPSNAFPFSFRPHYAQFVDPVTGDIKKIVVVPSAQAMSWEDGYACYHTQDINSIASASEKDHPMLIVLAHDGDNDFGGGYSYYEQCVSGFSHDSSIHPSTISSYLAQFPVDADDVVKVEDGAWVNKDGDFGSPDIDGWAWPLTADNGSFDIEHGWDCNQRNWAVITAGQNYVETAEQMSGGVDVNEVQEPSASATAAEIAWHFFLPSVTSGYMYYGTILDMADKESLACNNALKYAKQAIESSLATDQTPPSIWKPMRLPWNPGGYGNGVLYHWQMQLLPTDFYVWTYVFDVSGVSRVQFFYRKDADNHNPLFDIANEVFDPQAVAARLTEQQQQGLVSSKYSCDYEGVSDWTALDMNNRNFPANSSRVHFEYPPDAIADEYWIHLDQFQDVLIDYYVEAEDVHGNVKKSDIFSVYIGTGKP